METLGYCRMSFRDGEMAGTAGSQDISTVRKFGNLRYSRFGNLRYEVMRWLLCISWGFSQ